MNAARARWTRAPGHHLGANTAFSSVKLAAPARPSNASVSARLVAARMNAPHATQEQTFATDAQWASGIARANLGSEQVQAGGAARSIADLTELRARNPWVKPRGVMKIQVDVPLDAPDITTANVRGAAMLGVAQEVADQLWRRPLVHTPIPVLLDVSSFLEKPIKVTRDEVGRVRVDTTHARADQPPARGEPQWIGIAETLVDRILSRSLEDWGVPKVRTDDATDRENQR